MQMKRIVHARWDKYGNKFDYSIFESDWTENGYVKLEEVIIDFESIPEKELRVLQAQALRTRLQKMRAEHHRDQCEVEQEITELLALEYKPAADEDNSAAKADFEREVYKRAEAEDDISL